MRSELKKFIELLKNKFYRQDNVYYPAYFAEKMIDETYEEFEIAVDDDQEVVESEQK